MATTRVFSFLTRTVRESLVAVVRISIQLHVFLTILMLTNSMVPHVGMLAGVQMK